MRVRTAALVVACVIIGPAVGALSTTWWLSIRAAGERMFVDYAGKKLTVIDGETGEVMSAGLFVAELGASNYT